MNKNIIRNYLKSTFITEASETNASGTPGLKLAKKIGKENKTINSKGVGEVASDLKDYEKSSTKPDPEQKSMAPNKFNYNGEKEKEYHDEMEIMNGQEMIQYDRKPNDEFSDRAMEAIEGSARMGNDPKWANVVAKGQGGDPEFGKNLVKKIKSSIDKRNKQTPTTKMFGDDWEVTKQQGHKDHAFEGKTSKKPLTENNTTPLIREDVKSLVRGKMYTWTMGAEYMPIKYIGMRAKFPKIEVGSSVGKGFIFQFADGSYIEIGISTIKKYVEETDIDEDANSDWGSEYGDRNAEEPSMEPNSAIVARKKAQAAKKPEADIAGDNYEDSDRAQKGRNVQYENKIKTTPQIKETMKRLKFKSEFKGVGNALKLIPESYRTDNKVFEMTDGNESYKIRWEGSLTEGRAIVLVASDKNMVNEDIQHMKHLFGYKSQDTLGTVKGKARIDENQVFNDIWKKTRKLMGESEDIEGQDAEAGDPDGDSGISQAPEAKKHIEGSTSTDKGTKAPKPKSGEWEKIAVPHAAEAKKHVEGSVSTDKGTKAPKAKMGDPDGGNVSQASEAKKDVKGESVKKKPITEDFGDEDDDSDVDAPEVPRKDAYDASLDTPDVDDMAKGISKKDIAGAAAAPKMVNKDADFDDDEEDDEFSAPAPAPAAITYKLLKSPSGEYFAKASNSNSPVPFPSQYVELAKTQGMAAAMAKVQSGRSAMAESKRKIAESVRLDIERASKKLLAK